MKKILIIAALLIAGAFNVYSQETYVGVQYQRSNPDVRQSNFRFDKETDTIGVNASRTNYVFRNVGATGEITANFKSDTSQLYTFLGGVTVKSRANKVQPFVRVLGGVAVQRAKNEVANNYRTDEGFAYSVGGGVDYKLGRVSLRLLQADFLRTHIYNKGANSVRLGTGIVF